jgi:hypothetical protein
MTIYQHPQLQINDGIMFPELMSHVETLQQWLKNWGVLPKDSRVDGRFGPFTKSAVERFQSLRPPGSKFASQGLQVTGMVNQNTWAELLKAFPHQIQILPRPKPNPVLDVPGFNVEQLIQNAVPPELHKISQQTIPLILTECIKNQCTNQGMIAYILATAEHESHLGNLMTEIGDEDYFVRSYDPPSRVAQQLGNTQPGDGLRYRGRGFVQITGRRNYTDWAKRLGLDLIHQPEMATNPAIAAKILVIGMLKGTFTGVALSEFISNTTQDFVNARRVVNGLDRSEHIAAISKFYYNALT